MPSDSFAASISAVLPERNLFATALIYDVDIIIDTKIMTIRKIELTLNFFDINKPIPIDDMIIYTIAGLNRSKQAKNMEPNNNEPMLFLY